MRTRLSVQAQAALSVLPCLLLLAAPAAHAQDAYAEDYDRFGSAVARGDFNGDGYEDLAVGVPGEDVTTKGAPLNAAGAVEVVYGTSSGLGSPNRQFLRQGSAGVEDVSETGDAFGSSLAAGDFNGDGYDDLAIGVPHESLGSVLNAGAVNVIYGSASGLSATNVPDQFWHQDVANVAGVAEAGDNFGESLVAGDFNGDGHDDLAVGVPFDNVFSVLYAGAVNVLYGSATGLSATTVPDQFWHQDSANVEDTAEPVDYFGYSLAAGDFNGDGRDDLAIGVPNEDVGTVVYAGAVNVIYGSAAGLSATAVADQLWHQNVFNVEDSAEPHDNFGWSLAAGDFNGDGRDDLAIGVNWEDVSTATDAGAVNVIYGSASGLSATAVPDQFWHQFAGGVEDVAEPYDEFGYSLAAGDFNGDGRDDLAIGVPYEGVGTVVYAGAVNVIYGSASGLSATAVPDQLWYQDAANVEDSAETSDHFGWSLAAGDFNGDGRDDLAIGVPSENLEIPPGTLADAGAVNAIYGSSTGLSATAIPDQLWTQPLCPWPPCF